MLNIPRKLEVDPAFAPMLRLTDGIFLRPGELARHWRITVGHLGWMRRNNKGPAHVKLGRHVVYRLSDVLAYEIAKQRGPVTPDSLAIALASVPALPPAARDMITSRLTEVLFNKEWQDEPRASGKLKYRARRKSQRGTRGPTC